MDNSEGDHCEIKVDGCVKYMQPCGNNGDCESKDDGGFDCVCHQGYEGTVCESIIPFCTPDPCLNGGICSYGIVF